MITIIYLLIGIYLSYHYDMMPFKEKNKWVYRSWLLFIVFTICWLPIVIIMFFGKLIQELKQNGII